MSEERTRQVSEEEARQVAEASRETEWQKPSFMREMFLGNFRFDLLHPYPDVDSTSPEFEAFFRALKEFIAAEVDSTEIDRTGEYPEHVVEGLRKLGAFGMKIPTKYGGLGFSQLEYAKDYRLWLQPIGSAPGMYIERLAVPPTCWLVRMPGRSPSTVRIAKPRVPT